MAEPRTTLYPVKCDYRRPLTCRIHTYRSTSYACLLTWTQVGTVAEDGLFESMHGHDYRRLYFHRDVGYASQRNVDKAHARIELHLTQRADLPGLDEEGAVSKYLMGTAIASHYRIPTLTIAEAEYCMQATY